jgi:hypothetical protein
MFWANLGPTKQISHIPLRGDPEATRKDASARIIRALYSDILPQYVQVNAPVYEARNIQNLPQTMDFLIMIWPPYSPDLSPIEKLWSLLKCEIYKLDPGLETADDTVATKYRLETVWANIQPEILIDLSRTMPHRVQAVIEANGWYTEC